MSNHFTTTVETISGPIGTGERAPETIMVGGYLPKELADHIEIGDMLTVSVGNNINPFREDTTNERQDRSHSDGQADRGEVPDHRGRSTATTGHHRPDTEGPTAGTAQHPMEAQDGPRHTSAGQEGSEPMSRQITTVGDLNGTDLGKRIRITQPNGGTTVEGHLIEVLHEAQVFTDTSFAGHETTTLGKTTTTVRMEGFQSGDLDPNTECREVIA